MNRLMKKEEVITLLRISPCTLDKWIYLRKIPFVRLGGGIKSSIRFDEKALQQWLVKVQEKES